MPFPSSGLIGNGAKEPVSTDVCVHKRQTHARAHTHTKKRCSWHNPLVFFEGGSFEYSRGSQDQEVTTADNEIYVPGKSQEVSQRHRRQRDPHAPFRQETEAPGWPRGGSAAA